MSGQAPVYTGHTLGTCPRVVSSSAAEYARYYVSVSNGLRYSDLRVMTFASHKKYIRHHSMRPGREADVTEDAASVEGNYATISDSSKWKWTSHGRAATAEHE